MTGNLLHSGLLAALVSARRDVGVAVMRSIGIAALAILVVACHQRPEAIAPDAEIDFSCGNAPDENAIETFLTAQGFTHFNEERARRGREKGFFPLQIDGYNSRRWMLDLVGLKVPPSHGGRVNYRLTITSPPPTRHDAALERAAERFVRATLECRVQSLRMHDNGADSISMFDHVFAEEQRRIADWRRCARLDSVCPR